MRITDAYLFLELMATAVLCRLYDSIADMDSPAMVLAYKNCKKNRWPLSLI